MLQNILGTHLELPVRLAIATVVIVALLGLTAFIVRHLSGQTRVPGGRSRQGRLAVMDTVPVDQKRRLVLVRRDDVEHLLLIGGNRDLVVEPGITREPGLLREAPPEREALGARETPLLRRTSTAAPLAAPEPAPALASIPEASAPAVPPPAAESAEPDSSTSRFAALRRPRPDVDFASRLQRPASEDKDEDTGLAATQEPPLAPRRLFETRIKRPKIGQAKPEASEPKPTPASLAAVITPPADEAGESARHDGTVGKPAVPAEITPVDVTSDVEVHQPATEVTALKTESVAVEIAEVQAAEAPAPVSAASSHEARSGHQEPETKTETDVAEVSPVSAPSVEEVAPPAAKPVISQPAAVADIVPRAAQEPDASAPPVTSIPVPESSESAAPRAGELFITPTPWPQEALAAEPVVPPFEAPQVPQAPIPHITEEDMAQRPAAARRPPVFNFARQPREAQPAGRDLNLGDLAERLRGSLEKSLKPEPVEPRLDSAPHEPAIPEASAQPDHTPQPAPVAHSAEPRPSGLFRSTPIPEAVIKGEVHPIHEPAGTGPVTEVSVEESHVVRVVEPEKPLPAASLDFESDFMRELELTLAGEAQTLRAEPVPSHQDDTLPTASHTQAGSSAPTAESPAAPVAANEPDPFEDLEAEMASLLGRMPTTKRQG